MTFGNVVQIREGQVVDFWSIKNIKHKLEFKAEQIFSSLILTAEPKISITLEVSCGFESHYKDEVLLNRR